MKSFDLSGGVTLKMRKIEIDLRSDTVTKPTPGMRKAMYEAEVGDDVLGDDPTVNRLQEMIAEMAGKEAALFVPSGTMSNQIGIKVHTQPGDEVICERDSHIFNYECGAPALISSVQLMPVPGYRGIMDVDDVRKAIRVANIHHPRTRLIVIENTHNRAGGTIYPIEEIKRVFEVAKEYGLKLHLDGARLWNAHVETGISIEEYSRYFDTVSLCFSKGLGAPVGSILVGDKKTIEEARRVRKFLGGGMRQVGILAAACIYALENHIYRLKEDHANAKKLAAGVNRIDGLNVDMRAVQTNIVMIDIEREDIDAYRLCDILLERGIGMLPVNAKRVRAVTNLNVSEADIDRTVSVLEEVFSS